MTKNDSQQSGLLYFGPSMIFCQSSVRGGGFMSLQHNSRFCFKHSNVFIHNEGCCFFREGDKLFSRSARAQRLRDDNLSVNWRDGVSPRTPRSPHSSRHASPQPLGAGGIYADDRTTIASSTRNIAALAAKKRSKAQNNLLNMERQYGGEPRSLYRPTNDDAYLSPHTLAKHNQSYGDVVLPSIHKPPSEDNLSNATKQSVNTDNSNLPPIRTAGRKVAPKESDLKRNRRTRGYDNSYTSQVWWTMPQI